MKQQKNCTKCNKFILTNGRYCCNPQQSYCIQCSSNKCRQCGFTRINSHNSKIAVKLFKKNMCFSCSASEQERVYFYQVDCNLYYCHSCIISFYENHRKNNKQYQQRIGNSQFTKMWLKCGCNIQADTVLEYAKRYCFDCSKQIKGNKILLKNECIIMEQCYKKIKLQAQKSQKINQKQKRAQLLLDKISSMIISCDKCKMVINGQSVCIGQQKDSTYVCKSCLKPEKESEKNWIKNRKQSSNHNQRSQNYLYRALALQCKKYTVKKTQKNYKSQEPLLNKGINNIPPQFADSNVNSPSMKAQPSKELQSIQLSCRKCKMVVNVAQYGKSMCLECETKIRQKTENKDDYYKVDCARCLSPYMKPKKQIEKLNICSNCLANLFSKRNNDSNNQIKKSRSNKLYQSYQRQQISKHMNQKLPQPVRSKCFNCGQYETSECHFFYQQKCKIYYCHQCTLIFYEKYLVMIKTYEKQFGSSIQMQVEMKCGCQIQAKRIIQYARIYCYDCSKKLKGTQILLRNKCLLMKSCYEIIKFQTSGLSSIKATAKYYQLRQLVITCNNCKVFYDGQATGIELQIGEIYTCSRCLKMQSNQKTYQKQKQKQKPKPKDQYMLDAIQSKKSKNENVQQSPKSQQIHKKVNDFNLSQCKICFNAQSNMINRVCRHLMMCSKCYTACIRKKGSHKMQCPLCSTLGEYIEFISPIYS